MCLLPGPHTFCRRAILPGLDHEEVLQGLRKGGVHCCSGSGFEVTAVAEFPEGVKEPHCDSGFPSAHITRQLLDSLLDLPLDLPLGFLAATVQVLAIEIHQLAVPSIPS